jgi:hypothetical protein
LCKVAGIYRYENLLRKYFYTIPKINGDHSAIFFFFSWVFLTLGLGIYHKDTYRPAIEISYNATVMNAVMT